MTAAAAGRRACAGLAALLIVVFVGSLAPSAAQTAPPVTIRRAVNSVDAVQWPDYVAQAEGFYQREGLEVEDTLMDARTTVSALIGGSIDVSWADSTTYVLAFDRGAKLICVGWGMDRLPYRLMAAPSIKRISELKGKLVNASAPAETYTTVLRDILKKAGLDPDKDVTFVYGGSSNQRTGALESGAVQAALLPMPANLILAAKGFNSLLFTPDYYPSLLISLTLTRTDWAEQHADVLRRYLRAQNAALAWLYRPANKARAIEILASATKTTPQIASRTYDYYIGRRVFPRDACPRTAGWGTLLQIMDETGRTKLTPADAGKLIDARWCTRA